MTPTELKALEEARQIELRLAAKEREEQRIQVEHDKRIAAGCISFKSAGATRKR